MNTYDNYENEVQVLFKGGFSSGKSTLLNALMRKRLLRTSINPETAVITKIVFNADEKVIVYKKSIDEFGNQKYEEMTVEGFFEKYSLDEGEEINYPLFDDIDYVRLQQPEEGICGSMVQLVDSPGTEHTKADDNTAKGFAKKASAIVYVINALMAFDEFEKEYIKNHFVNPKAETMKNLFFVVNRIDGVADSRRPYLKDRVRKELNDVFLKADGSFDEELFNKRVFYTNAYKAECARTNIAIENEDGDMVVPDEKNTGIPEFEKALTAFLFDEKHIERKKDEQMSIYAEKQKLIDEVILDLSDLSELLGAPDESKKGKYGFVPGLNLETEEETIQEQIQNLKEGIFQVLFTGGFSSGKSTILNALMRKSLLRTGINPETAVITKIIFNADEKVIVYKKATDAQGKQKYEEMTIADFFETYSIDEGEEANYDLFNDIDYVRLEQPQDGIGGSMVQLVDSPGTGHTKADDNTAKGFARKASAIVYIINATDAFKDYENEYIKNHFVDPNSEPMKNLFFVVNRYDGVSEDEKPNLKRRVRKNLNDVFLKLDGTFDEELFEKRVFYTNAYFSLQARCNNKVRIPGIGEIMPVDEETGVPEFEKALGEFLVDESRDKDALTAYIPTITGVYKNAKDVTDKRYEKATQDLAQLETEAAQFEEDIQKVNDTLNGINDTTTNTVKQIILAAKDTYNDYVANVNNGWEKHFEQHPVGKVSVLGVGWDKIRGKDAEERFKPITDGIKSYLEGQYTSLEANINDIIKSELEKWEQSMKIYQLKLDSVPNVNLEEMLIRVAATKGINKVEHGEANLVKLILAILFSDPGLFVDGTIGNDSMGDFILKLIKTNILDALKVVILDSLLGGWGLIIFAINKILEISKHENKNTLEILAGAKTATIDKLNENKQKFSNELELNLSSALIKTVNVICKDINANLAEIQKENQNIIELRKNEALNTDEMKKQIDDNLKKMREIIENIARNVNYSGKIMLG